MGKNRLYGGVLSDNILFPPNKDAIFWLKAEIADQWNNKYQPSRGCRINNTLHYTERSNGERKCYHLH